MITVIHSKTWQHMIELLRSRSFIIFMMRWLHTIENLKPLNLQTHIKSNQQNFQYQIKNKYIDNLSWIIIWIWNRKNDDYISLLITLIIFSNINKMNKNKMINFLMYIITNKFIKNKLYITIYHFSKAFVALIKSSLKIFIYLFK